VLEQRLHGVSSVHSSKDWRDGRTAVTLDLGMDAFLLDISVVAVAGVCLAVLSFGLRLFIWHEPRPIPAEVPAPLAFHPLPE
jgi:hypothetical protein